jgi:hypothetical protein
MAAEMRFLRSIEGNPKRDKIRNESKVIIPWKTD